MIVDCHNHVLPTEALELLASERAFRARVDGDMITGDGHSDFRNGLQLRPTFHDPSAKLDDLAEQGIDGAVVSVTPPLFFYETDSSAGAEMAEAVNAGLARFCSHDPARLRWLAHVPMQDPLRAANMLEGALGAGAVGVEVGTSIAGARLDDRRFEPFWEAADAMSALVQIHPAYNQEHPALNDWYLQNSIGNPLETTIAAERLVCAGTLDRHPRVRWFLVHAGGFLPYQLGRLAHTARVRPELRDVGDPWAYLDRFWFDTIAHDRAALAYLVERVTPARVVLGTDLPFDMAPVDPVGQVREALDHDVAQFVLRNGGEALVGPERRF